MAKNQYDMVEKRQRNKEWMSEQYKTYQKSGVDIAKELNIGISTIYKWLKRHQIEFRSPYSECYLKKKIGQNSPNWKGGKPWMGNHGYLVRNIRRKKFLEHHLIFCKEFGIETIPENHIVHHLDGVKTNNSPKNLFLMHMSVHIAYHILLKKSKERGLIELENCLKNNIKSLGEIASSEGI